MTVTKGRIWALILCGLVPLAGIGLGVILLIANTLWNWAFILTYVVLPFAAIAGLVGIHLFVKKLGSRIAGTVLLLLAFLLCSLFGNMIGKFEMLDRYEGTQLASHYRAVTDEFERMPALDQIGEPENIIYYDYFSSQAGIFTCDADALICRYDREGYELQKETIAHSYRFQEDRIEYWYNNCDPSAELDGWRFHLLAEDETGIDYPKRLIFIGFHEQEQQIVYLSFYDDDLDYISDLEAFLLDDCGWKHMQ